ncbi:Protein polyglycylase TTLL10 isoform 1 [Schistosoma japonicum]|uniref:Protein polyglycylase TTLL10 isoform 1 n=1 Tax=Schistosoma japonicum TaxID=6182 RepID=A0A4Z2D4L2_SCHJA|nr:Protein polyglycylase TTLL10 isoform 1 [Schistosoma japonicum]
MLTKFQSNPIDKNIDIISKEITTDKINNIIIVNPSPPPPSTVCLSTTLSPTMSRSSVSSSSKSSPPNSLSLKNNENKISEENVKVTGSNKSTIRNLPPATHRIPVYYLSRGNNSQLIDTVMTELGWKRTFDRHADFTLRWTENSVQINYAVFKEGEQLVNHIPNCGLLTNKLGLLLSLRDHERRYQKRFGRLPIMLMDEFFPKTFIVDDPKEREAYFKLQEDDDTSPLWICKPIGQNQEFKIHLKNRDDEARNQPSGLLPRIIQRYIINPLLLDGCKFDIRCYILIACTMPYLVFYHPGYIRRSAKPYSSQDPNLITHLTNQFVQKKDPDYVQIKNNTVWSWSQVNDYINRHYQEEKKLPVDWSKTVLQWRIQRIIHHVFTTVKNRLATRIGFFELLGLDFMLDENMKVWLLEVNSNPALQTHCDVLKEVVPVVVKDALHISIECFEKSRHQKPLLPLHGLDNLSAFMFCQRSNRQIRMSLDEMPVVNKISGDLGLPIGWNLLYNESQAAFQARWPLFQSSSLRSWIPPRYKPSVIQNNSNLQQPNNESSNNNNHQNKMNNVSFQTCESTVLTNEHAVTLTTTKEQNTSQSTVSNQLFYPRLSLPEYRKFEYSLRRYPILTNSMNNNNKSPKRNSVSRQSLQNVKQTINLRDIIEKVSQPASFITVKQPINQNKPINTYHSTSTINTIMNTTNYTTKCNSSNSSSNSRQITINSNNQSTKQLLSNVNNSAKKNQHDTEVFNEDELLTRKQKTIRKLNLISINREPVQISRVHLITNSEIDKVFNDNNSNNSNKMLNDPHNIPLTTVKHTKSTNNQSTGIRSTHISNNSDYNTNLYKSKLTGRSYANSNKLTWIEPNDPTTITYESKYLRNKLKHTNYAFEDRGS